MSRPLLQKGIADLEQLFAVSLNDLKTLKQLKNELKHRHVPRAVALLKAVDEALSSQGLDFQSKQMPLIELQQMNFPQEGINSTTLNDSAPTAILKELPSSNPNSNALLNSSLNSPSLSIPQDAFKVLNVPQNSPWESIEKARRKIVELANPGRLEMLQVEQRSKLIQDAKNANAAYAFLLNLRIDKPG